VVDKAVAQGQPIDAAKIIEIATLRAAPRHDPASANSAGLAQPADDRLPGTKDQTDSDCSENG
jgi:hypothetical protein